MLAPPGQSGRRDGCNAGIRHSRNGQLRVHATSYDRVDLGSHVSPSKQTLSIMHVT